MILHLQYAVGWTTSRAHLLPLTTDGTICNRRIDTRIHIHIHIHTPNEAHTNAHVSLNEKTGLTNLL